jgi:hypothetical protein
MGWRREPVCKGLDSRMQGAEVGDSSGNWELVSSGIAMICIIWLGSSCKEQASL